MEKSTPLLNPSHFRFDTSQDFQIIESPLINSPLLPSLENNPKTPSLPIVLFANSLRSSWNDIAYNILRSVHSENSFEKKGEFGSILKKHSFLKKDLNPSPQNDKKINFNEESLKRNSTLKSFLKLDFIRKKIIPSKFKKEKTLVSRQNNSFRDNDNYDNNSINDSNLSFKKEEEKLKNLVRRHSCHCDLCGKNTIKLKITCNFETKQSLNIKQKKINADLSAQKLKKDSSLFIIKQNTKNVNILKKSNLLLNSRKSFKELDVINNEITSFKENRSNSKEINTIIPPEVQYMLPHQKNTKKGLNNLKKKSLKSKPIPIIERQKTLNVKHQTSLTARSKDSQTDFFPKLVRSLSSISSNILSNGISKGYSDEIKESYNKEISNPGYEYLLIKNNTPKAYIFREVKLKKMIDPKNNDSIIKREYNLSDMKNSLIKERIFKKSKLSKNKHP